MRWSFRTAASRPTQLLGEEGEGFINTLQVLDSGRIGIAALSVGLAQGAYEAALRYAKERRQFGQPIAAFQAIRWKLADNATRIEAARLLTYRAAYMKDRGADDPGVVHGEAVRERDCRQGRR